MDKVKKLESEIEKFNGRLEIVSEKKEKERARKDFFNKIKEEISQILSALSELKTEVFDSNVKIENIEFPDNTESIVKMVIGLEKSFISLISKIEKQIGMIPRPVDNTDKILEAISKIPVTEIPNFPEIIIPDIPVIPEFPVFPEPVKSWTFNVKKENNGEYTVRAIADG